MARGFTWDRVVHRARAREEHERYVQSARAGVEQLKDANRKGVYASDKALLEDAVKVFLAAGDSAWAQSRGDTIGFDGISSEQAVTNAKWVWAAMQKARLFAVHPERWMTLYHLSDRFVEEKLVGLEWEPPKSFKDLTEAQVQVEYEKAQKVYEAYEEQGTHWPFPDPMPFDAVFFSYGKKLRLSASPLALFTRIRRDVWEEIGAPQVYLVGQLLAWSGETPYAFSVIEYESPPTRSGDSIIKPGSVAFICTYFDGEWYQPASLDPWILGMLVRSINDHKKIIQGYQPTLGQRLDRKKASKLARQLLPLPAPFYMVNLKDELMTHPSKKAGELPGRAVEWSHRWDVRGHECVRIERGQLPLDPALRHKLKKRGYNIYEGVALPSASAEEPLAADNNVVLQDFARMTKRGFRPPGPGEWLAVLSYWREAMIKGPADKPYVPSARVGA